MKLKDKIILSLALFLLFCWLVYSVKSALAPFIFSLVIAYFLNPLVNYLQKKRLPRALATSVVFGLFLALIIALAYLLLPIIYVQLIGLIWTLPDYFAKLASTINPFLTKFGINFDGDFSNILANKEISNKIFDLWQNVFDSAITSSKTLINIISLVFIAPILIFYLLKDWNLFIKKIDSYLPKNSANIIRKIAIDIDKTLSGYVRGQFHVCFILAIIYASLLSYTGLNFGFLIGFLTGVLAFIPYIGMLCGIIAATISGLFQWGFDIYYALSITGVFLFGQLIESNFLTPKLIGNKVGLHPAWIIFGLFFFGALFGFIGVLFAIPLTAICGVVIKHFALEYKKKFT
jgi:predicted PurR-regulated permease PerM